MFNSPAQRQTPRRSRLTRGGAGPDTPSLLSSRQSIAPGSAYPDHPPSVSAHTPSVRSRLHHHHHHAAAAYRDSPTASLGGETVRTVREMEGYERVWWSRAERYGVCGLGQLPKEVGSLVRDHDLINDPVSGSMDPTCGFAFVVTSTQCTAWNYTKRTHSSPTCYTLPAPSLSYGQMSPRPPVLAALYTGSSAEPGMILVSPTGEVRFWESMSSALANVDRYHVAQVELGDDEFAEKISKIDASTFVITTTASTAFRLSISTHSGRASPIVTPLTRPGGMFGRATSTIFSNREDRQGITAVAVGTSNLYLLAGRIVQRWTVSPDSIKFAQEYDLHEAVGMALFEESWGEGVNIETSDIVALSDDRLACLVSYTQQQGSSGSPNLQNSHAIITFDVHPRSSGLAVSRIVELSHAAQPDVRAVDVPRLFVPNGAEVAFVRFAAVIVIVALSEDSQHEEIIQLKNPEQTAFIGVGMRAAASPSSAGKAASSIEAMTLTGGLMSIEAYLPANSAQRDDMSSSTAVLKSKMEQAVFFGDRADNPLSFDLDSGSQGDVAVAAEAVSAEVLDSSSAYMTSIYELRPQLQDKLQRLREIMLYIRRNGLMSLLPQSSRRNLSRDAEKVKAAIELWDHQDRLMDQINTQSPASLLADSILSYMHLTEAYGDYDLVRTFFRQHVQDLDKLLETVFAHLQRAVSTLRGSDSSDWVVAANRTFVAVFQSAAIVREDDIALYELDRLRPPSEYWTASSSLIAALDTLYTTTEQLIKDRTRELGSVVDRPPSETGDARLRVEQGQQELLKVQMTMLAAALLTNMEDKLRTASIRSMESGADEQEGLTLKKRWDEMKPRVIRPLVGIDRVTQAYELAEHHLDFPTLVWLCHDPVAGQGLGKVQTYIERYGEEFAFVLYQWYIDQGKFTDLLNQDEVYGALLTKFFEMNSYPELAWMHHIACRRYGQAAAALVNVDRQASALEQKHIISSIGKLAAVADLRAKGESDKRKQRLIDIDDELDLIKAQNNLRDQLLSEGASAADRSDRRTPLQRFTQTHCAHLGGRQVLYQLFSDYAQQLVDGKALPVGALVDVLTLKDCRGEGAGDAAMALDRLVRDRELPEGRKQVALLSSWRRVFIRDDWTKIANTSGRSEEAQRQVLRNTLAYQTVKAVNRLRDFPPQFILSPYTTTSPPLSTELAARFPDWPAEDVQALMADHEAEIIVLGKYLQEADLERRVKEVAELVERDEQAAEDVEGDVFM